MVGSQDLGEALQFEWDTDESSNALWDAIELAAHAPGETLAQIESLAHLGSRLAMIYLGDVFALGRYGAEKNIEKASYWFKTARDKGSIEASFRLAELFEDGGHIPEAVAEYESLANQGYGPAMFALGRLYWRGEKVCKDRERAVELMLEAEGKHHIYATIFITKLMQRGYFGFASVFKGIWRTVLLTYPVFKAAYERPNSDAFRR